MCLSKIVFVGLFSFYGVVLKIVVVWFGFGDFYFVIVLRN